MKVNLSCIDVCNFECYIIRYQCKLYIQLYMSYASNEHILININVILMINMFVFNPLASIISHKRLDGTNYVSWKRNLNIVLSREGIIWVTLELLHVAPTKS